MNLLALTDDCLNAAQDKLAPPSPDSDGRVRPRLRITVYKNAFIEKWFAQAHPITPAIWFGWIVLWGLFVAVTQFPVLFGLLLFVLGIGLTTLIEYSLHRFIFHKAAHTEKEKLQHFLLHRYHHDYPNDPMRLVLPPIGVWPLSLLVAGIWYFVFGSYWLPIFAGTCAGFIAYEWTHYYTHHFHPKAGIGRWLKRYHMLHHYDSAHHRFGILVPLWDIVFGTYLPIKTLIRKGEFLRVEGEEGGV